MINISNLSKKCLALILIFTFVTVFSFASALKASENETVTLSSNTVVHIETVEEINSDRVSVGQTIDLRVKEDVTVDGNVVIEAGTKVRGTIQEVESSSMIGEAGRLTLQIDRTQAVDGTNISLSASRRAFGDDRQMVALGLGIFLCLPALLISGEEAVIHAGTNITAEVIGNYEISIE